MTALGLFLDILIATLLVITIAYCWLLNRRIRVLQDGKSELAQLLKHFDESTQRASDSIIALQGASKKIGESIQFRLDKANYLLEDLSFMIERGNKLADQMEAGFAVNRARNKVLAEQPVPGETASLKEPAKPAAVIDRQDADAEKAARQREKHSVLEAMLEKVIGRQKLAEAEAELPAEKPARSASRTRSKAEQELLDMIRTGIKG